MTIFGIIVAAVAVVVGWSAHHFSNRNDTPLEQVSESVIEKETGVKYDFSAADKEAKK